MAELGDGIDTWAMRILAELAAATRGNDADVGRVMRTERDERTLGAVVEMLLLARLSGGSAVKNRAARKLRELGYPVFALDVRSGRVNGADDSNM